jgi:hypothetical protein
VRDHNSLYRYEADMEALGVVMTVFTMFGMLVLVIASVTTDDGLSSTAMIEPPEAASAASEFKDAA